MSDLFWLTEEQMERLRPFFSKSYGKPRVDVRRVLSGIVFVMMPDGAVALPFADRAIQRAAAGARRFHHQRIAPGNAGAALDGVEIPA